MTPALPGDRKQWIELGEIFLTDVPSMVIGRGKSRQLVARPGVKPTAYYLFVNECTQLKRSVRRKRTVVTLTGKGHKDLDSKLSAFIERDDVVYPAENA